VDALCKDAGIVVVGGREGAGVVDACIVCNPGGVAQREISVDVDIIVDPCVFQVEVAGALDVAGDVPCCHP
jgi:hypothetical protein